MDINKQYSNEIKNYKLLSKEEEIKLFQDYNDGKKCALDKIVAHNLLNVVIICRSLKYITKGVEFDDVVSEGNIGLLRAIKTFDHTLGYRFVTYAKQNILNSVIRYLRNDTNVISFPDRKAYIFNKLNKIDEKDLDDVMSEMNLTKRQKEDYKLFNNLGVDSLDELKNKDDGDTTSFQVEDTTKYHSDDLDYIQQALHILNDRERTIIVDFYGVGGVKKLKLTEIMAKLNLTKSNVAATKGKALVKLKKYMSNDGY